VRTLPLTREIVHEAQRLREAGRFAEAEAAYKRALASDPNQATCWYNLGFVQRQQGRVEQALVSYGEALKRGVARPEEVHLNRAAIYADHLRREAEAERELNRALKLNPGYTPALFNLANLNEDRGRRKQASALYERVLALDPAALEALARLANIAAPKSDGEALIARVRAALAKANPAQRASLGFALGRLLDQAGAYDEAFAAYAEANRMSRSCAGPGAYDRAGEERQIDDIIAAFPAASAREADATASKAPIFICGMFRSGSTLAEQILAGHPRVTPGGELALVPALAARIGYPAGVAQVSGADWARLAAQYRAALSGLFPGGDLISDKRPDNFRYIGLIKSLFPTARIVHTTRHPLDNILSVYFLHLDHSMGYALDLSDAAHHYRNYRRLMAHWKSLYGGDIVDFDYDAFVREPRPRVEALLASLGLDWNEECLAFHRRTNAVKTASVWQVREPLYQRASGRWRNYAAELEPVRQALSDLIED
jgi:tetratricopeptide (TPR) repeat protein